jgi:uncharacterized membrane protein YbhN (UPF0104 family)
VRWRDVMGGYLIGAGINAVLPARGGDLVRIYTVRHRIEGATTPTLAASMLAETIFDSVVASILVGWAAFASGLPLRPRTPDVPAFEWGWLSAHPRATLVIAAVLLLGIVIVIVWLAGHVRRFWARVRQGLTILRTPRTFLRRVVLFQALGWCCRVAAAYELLSAFHVHATVTNALLALVVSSISTLLPITPGGAGAQQAMLAIVLAGEASRSQLLAYSVGAQAATATLNVVVGLAAMLLVFRHVSPWRLRRAASSGA